MSSPLPSSCRSIKFMSSIDATPVSPAPGYDLTFQPTISGSQSSSSSINELSYIIGSPSGNDCQNSRSRTESVYRSPVALTASDRSGSNPRKQHTLDSITHEKSGSRSPIVDATSRHDGSRRAAATEPERRRKSASTNPFEIETNFDEPDRRAGSRVSADIKRIERISADSFERRRSIYEVAPIESADRHSRRTSAASRGRTEDSLSLDKILADLQAGVAAGDNLAVEATELRELKSSIGTREASTEAAGRGLERSDSSDRSSQASSRHSSRAPPMGSKERPERRRHEMKTGFEVVWLDFTYSVGPNILEDPRWGKVNGLFHKEHRMILKGLSGGFKSGQMVAMMGPSGAGKTCLLECISGVRRTGIGGRLRLRGRRTAQLVIVPQYDDFLPQFTVEEIVVFGSRMKNPASTNHRQVANEVIGQLGLEVCRSNNIQRCSGGQRKRVAIAQELVSRPNILILDEPTSGLDSSCCYQTIRVLRDVLDQSVASEQPMAIVSTIHQPSAKVFQMFDLVYLLGKSGYAAYSGPPGELLPTIRDVTGLECPQYSNPSDFMIELVAYDYGEEPVARLVEYELEKARRFVRDYDRRAGAEPGAAAPQPAGARLELANGRLAASKSDSCIVARESQSARRMKAQSLMVEHLAYENNVSVQLRRATSSVHVKHPFFWHILVHLHRSFLQSVRDPILNNMRILIHLGFASLLVLLYGKKSGEARGCPPVLGLPGEITDPNNESIVDLGDNIGYLFMCIMMITYVSLMSTVLTFPIDIKTVGKEYKNGWYGTFTYFLGKSLADLPFIVLYPVAYCMITWFLTNQGDGQHWRYLSFNGLIIMNAMNSQSFGLILGALFVNSVTAATFLGPVITIPWYLFTGFTKRVHRLAEPWRTISRFLFTRHAFEGLLDTVYGHGRCDCRKFLERYHQLRYEEASRLGQLVSMETLSSLDYYDGLGAAGANASSAPGQWLEKTVDAASTVFAAGESLDLAGLVETNGRASSLFSFGLDFEPTCPSDYQTYIVQDFRLDEDTTQKAFLYTLVTLAVVRVLTFAIVSWKIRTRQL